MANSYRLGSVHTNLLTTSELQTEFRDYKLKVLNNEITFTPSKDALEKHKDVLSFISHHLPNDIISGSLALNILGLLYRDTTDIDIIINDKNRYPKYDKDGYDDVEFSTPNRLGYIDFKYKRGIFTKEKEYKVDFFHNESSSFIEVDFNGEKLKIHNPLEIMDYKLNMAINSKVYSSTSRKHNEDLTRIFGQTSWQLSLKGELI
jgi:hypothetical protein